MLYRMAETDSSGSRGGFGRVSKVPQYLLHLFPPNLGGSARMLDKMHSISAVVTAYLTVKLKQGI